MTQVLPPDGPLAAVVAVSAIMVFLFADLRKAAVLFFVFCVFMAAAWFRLHFFWIGMAEVLIGALMTGFTAWYALGRLPGFPGPDATAMRWFESPPAGMVLSLLGSLVLMGFLAVSVCHFFFPFTGFRYEWYAASGIPVAGAGFFSLSYHRGLLRRLFAFNVLGSGIFLCIAGFSAKRALSMDVAYAMVITGLLAAFFASLMVVILIGRQPVTGAPQAPPGDGKNGS